MSLYGPQLATWLDEMRAAAVPARQLRVVQFERLYGSYAADSGGDAVPAALMNTFRFLGLDLDRADPTAMRRALGTRTMHGRGEVEGLDTQTLREICEWFEWDRNATRVVPLPNVFTPMPLSSCTFRETSP